jgi:ubiquinone/menaquinone biosynthesis C-methylase UbiE
MEYVKSVDLVPSTPAAASSRYGYQTIPHVAAPNRSAQVGAERGTFKPAFYNSSMNDLPFTGERFIPGTRGEIWIEHGHRYHFASAFVGSRRVLDLACGEGYGSALLARRAAAVVGVDVSQQAIDHARRAYPDLRNVEFQVGSCTAIPAPDASIDVAVSFETLEHIAEQERFMDELARVLKPGGLLLISCPNKAEYTDRRGTKNEFHVKELYRDEFATLVSRRFPHSTWYGQKPTFYSVIAPENAAKPTAELVEVTEKVPDRGAAHLASPLYFIVAASRDRAALEASPAVMSVLADQDDWAYNDWYKVTRENWANQERIRELQGTGFLRRLLGRLVK